MRITSKEVYKSIDELPIYIWFKVFSTNDYGLLVKKGFYTDVELQWQWELIFDEFIKEFGVSPEFKKLFNLRKKLSILQNEYALSVANGKAKDWLLFKINLLNNDIEKINPNDKAEQSYIKVIVSVEKSIGRSINENEMSVLKFYTYLKDLENGEEVRG